METSEFGASLTGASPQLIEFDRFIDHNELCIIRLLIENVDAGAEEHKVQFSMTSQQCRELGEQLMIGAQVADYLRRSRP